MFRAKRGRRLHDAQGHAGMHATEFVGHLA